MSTHVFIAGTTNSGTGLLRGLMSSCDQLSVLPREGHHYTKLLPRDRGPNTKRMFALYPKKFRWVPGQFPETRDVALREIFHARWDMSKPFLVEKSPHNMMRAAYMASVFDPSKFVIITRSPFAVSEGLRRRKGHDIRRCAKQWSEAHRHLRMDLGVIDSVTVKYERLSVDPDGILRVIGEFLGVEFPLVDMSVSVRRQNMFSKPFSMGNAPDFNEESLKRLSSLDREAIWEEVCDEARYWSYDRE